MALTQADLDKLEEAIFSGAKKVKFSDREVEYRDLEEMLQAKSLMEKKLGKSGTRGRRTYASFSKGTK